MQNTSAGDAEDSGRRGLLHLPSGMKGGVLPSQKFQPTAVRHKRAQAHRGIGRRIGGFEPTHSAHHLHRRERDPDLGNSWASAASTMPDEGASRQGTPVVVEASPLRRRAIFVTLVGIVFAGVMLAADGGICAGLWMTLWGGIGMLVASIWGSAKWNAAIGSAN